jgi:hypothetical protein
VNIALLLLALQIYGCLLLGISGFWVPLILPLAIDIESISKFIYHLCTKKYLLVADDFLMAFRGQMVGCSSICTLFLLSERIMLVGIMRRLEILSICI